MKRLWVARIAGLLVLLSVLIGCAPKAAPVPASAPTAPSPTLKPAPAPGVVPKETWQEEWDRLLSAARREGTLVLYSTTGSQVRSALLGAFKEKFNIRIEFTSGRGAEIAQKLLAERQAGLYLADILNGTTTDMVSVLKPGGHLDPLKPLLFLPEVIDPKAWWHPMGYPADDLLWIDKERRYILVFNAYPQSALAINTSLIKPEEMKSFRDLLNPKLKGKIVMNDPTVAGSGLVTLRHIEGRVGKDFLLELVKQEPMIIRDQRLLVEWVARGKYAVCTGPKPEIVTEFAQAGAPIMIVKPAEGLAATGGSGTMGLVNRAPHPNAAKLFVNWLLTKEGQTVFSKALAAQSARLDVPTEHLNPLTLRQPGVEYYFQYNEDFLLGQNEAAKRFKEIFGELIK